MTYDYRKAMLQDITAYLADHEYYYYPLSDYGTPAQLADALISDLMTADAITGLNSGTYTFSDDDAKRYVMDNVELLKEALIFFHGYSMEETKASYEALDVCIRIYLLPEVVHNWIIENTETEFFKAD